MAPPLTAAELERLPIFPLPNATLFPGVLLPLHVFEPRYRDMVRDALAGQKMLAVARLRPGYEPQYEGRPPVHEVCGAGVIENHQLRSDGRYDIAVRGLSRVRIVVEHPPEHSYRLVRAERLVDAPSDPRVIAAFQAKLEPLWRRLAPHLPPPIRDLRAIVQGVDDASGYADRIAATIVVDPNEAQAVLEELDPAERVRMLIDRLESLAHSLSPDGGAAPLN
jgi:Lon protease-like protein